MPAARRSRAKTEGAGGGGSSPPPTPVELGIRYIARRLRFESEVASHLRGKGVRGRELEETLARLRELGMLSDFETCRAWVRDRLTFSPRSRSALRAELRAKKAGEAAAEQALEELCPAGSEVETATRALQRSARRFRELPEPVARRRMWGLLGRRGFDPETTREAIARVLEGSE